MSRTHMDRGRMEARGFLERQGEVELAPVSFCGKITL
jgi:hypothetical protein